MVSKNKRELELEMSAHTNVLGRAVFGTVRGLQEQGNGVLTHAPFALYEFEDGRQRDGILHSLENLDFAKFFRRIQDQNEELNLLGIVYPCRDAESRRGFFGTCIALPLDRQSMNGAQFSDWGSIDPILSQQIEAVRPMRDAASGQIIWRSMFQPSSTDQRRHWSKAPGNTLAMHAGKNASGPDVLRALQALAYHHGSTETTILVLSEPRAGSHALDSENAVQAIHRFQQDRDSAQSAPQTQAASTAETSSRSSRSGKRKAAIQTAKQSQKNATPKVETLDDAFQWIELLQDEMDGLRREIT